MLGVLEDQEVLKSPLVSIGIPVFNGSRYIGKAIESVLVQSVSNFELIICDNASTDNTRDIVLEYSRNDKRIIYHRHNKNIPPVDNFIRVLGYARGRYFSWLAHDDHYDSDHYLESLIKKLFEGYDFVFPNANIMRLDPDGCIQPIRANVYKDMHRSNCSRYVMCKDFIRVYGKYHLGMQIYGVFDRKKLLILSSHYINACKHTLIFSEGKFLHHVFIELQSEYVASSHFNYVVHGENISAGQKKTPPVVFTAYVDYTMNVIRIYVTSNFHYSEKVRLITFIIKTHGFEIFRLGASVIKFFTSRTVDKIIAKTSD